MDQSTVSRRSGKPAKPPKPHVDFPLYPHASGCWAKKVRGKRHYFGPWRDPDAALAEWLRVKDDLLAGRKPRPKGEPGGLTVQQLVNAYLTWKEQLRDNGEIKRRTFRDAYIAAGRVVEAFGRERVVSNLTPDDFAQLRNSLSQTLGHTSLGIEIVRIRSIFNWGYDNDLIENQVRFGTVFKGPSAKTRRLVAAERGRLDFQAEEVRTLIDKADIALRAMIYLGVNSGMGNEDVATLPQSALNFSTGWMDYPRPKTGVARRAKLWPKTIDALKAAIADRPMPKDEADAGLVFITRLGNPWAKDSPGNNPVSLRFTRLLKECDLHRDGVGFYSLRRTFETVAGGTADQVAVDHVMGHAPAASDMAARYRQGIEDSRLERVAEHVRAWLFAPTKKPKRKAR